MAQVMQRVFVVAVVATVRRLFCSPSVTTRCQQVIDEFIAVDRLARARAGSE